MQLYGVVRVFPKDTWKVPTQTAFFEFVGSLSECKKFCEKAAKPCLHMYALDPYVTWDKKGNLKMERKLSKKQVTVRKETEIPKIRFGTSEFKITYHKYGSVEPNVEKGTFTGRGRSWIDAVNQLINEVGSDKLFIDYCEEVEE